MTKLNSAQIKSALAKLPGWKQRRKEITCTYAFKDFVSAVKFVNRVAVLAEKAWHHPDIDIRWNRVTLVLSTHSEGGLTELDFKLAKAIERTA